MFTHKFLLKHLFWPSILFARSHQAIVGCVAWAFSLMNPSICSLL